MRSAQSPLIPTPAERRALGLPRPHCVRVRLGGIGEVPQQLRCICLMAAQLCQPALRMGHVALVWRREHADRVCIGESYWTLLIGAATVPGTL